MDQNELRSLERRCVQDELPPCTAACPIHVDVRTFTGLLAGGEWEKAWEVLARTMPLPGIVGRICDHPCETACKRCEAGGPIAVSELERACVERVGNQVRGARMPAKNRRVAVVGASLSGLTAAWDLLGKGYAVSIYARGDPGGAVMKMFPGPSFPRRAVDGEVNRLLDNGARFGDVAAGNGLAWLRKTSNEFDAVYVALDDPYCISSGFQEELSIDASTGRTGIAGVFGGGKGCLRRDLSPILDVFEGRNRAVSIDRFLQNVSLTAAREGEGPRPTRLHVNTAKMEIRERIRGPGVRSVYSPEEATEEAKRCMQCECMECVKNCVYLQSFSAYPRRYIREIYNNETILIGSHGHTNRLINSCSLCGLCAEVCPNGVSMAAVCLQGRKSLVDRKRMPPSFHEFALQDMLFSNSDHFAMVRNQDGFERSSFLFFPGCQLSGSSPAHVERTFGYLQDRLEGGVGLMLRCCGAPAYWAARDDLFSNAGRELAAQWEGIGRPKVIVACPTCYTMFGKHLPHAEVRSLWEVLAETGLPPLEQCGSACPVVSIHDPCTSRYNRTLQESVRAIISRLGYRTKELDLSLDRTECCGFGGLMSNTDPVLAGRVASQRARRSDDDYVTYCAMCRDALRSAGKRTVHVLDLVFEGNGAWDGMEPGRIKYSERRENRSRLRERMSSGTGLGKEREAQPYNRITLHIPPEVLERLDERRILTQDVRRVIGHAMEEGGGFYNRKTKTWLACHRPHTVTFWVEYAVEGENSFTICNAYGHRMQIEHRRPS